MTCFKLLRNLKLTRQIIQFSVHVIVKLKINASFQTKLTETHVDINIIYPLKFV